MLQHGNTTSYFYSPKKSFKNIHDKPVCSPDKNIIYTM